MTIRTGLEELYKKEMTKIPKKFINQNGLELIFDIKRGHYVGIEIKCTCGHVKDLHEETCSGTITKQGKSLPCICKKFNEGEKKEWLAAAQQIKTPIFWYDCPNTILKNGIEVTCNHKNFVVIFEDGKTKTCSHCKKEFTVKLVVSKTQACYDLLQELRKEQ